MDTHTPSFVFSEPKLLLLLLLLLLLRLAAHLPQ
jgi:hypothetical protein